MKTLKDLEAYRIIEQKEIREMNSLGTVLEHKKTGAKLFLMENDDDNKVFSIGFRTPPADSTGAVSYTHLDVYKRQNQDQWAELSAGDRQRR